MSTSKNEYYDMTRGQKTCFVFSNSTYRSKKDEITLRKTFIEAGYKVRVIKDTNLIKTTNILSEFSEFAKKKKVCAVIVFILSHGVVNGEVYVGSDRCNLNYMVNAMDTEILRGVPKMLFVQINKEYRSVYENFKDVIVKFMSNTNLATLPDTTVVSIEDPCPAHAEYKPASPDVPLDFYYRESWYTNQSKDVTRVGSPMIQELCKLLRIDAEFCEIMALLDKKLEKFHIEP
ncbi:hypothetical protein [Trichoplusia ni ascovirus 2c]|uniref:Caspase-like protein n=1 Tax=Trichoplusia ni ascovirus 2c TaxID=328615 RepID=CSPL_TNAVC|nr:hypothetical protein TNAV2c_gp072 [Trichoplusia ni ascovirus 2c]Q06VK9.1 RecName: Full=Caspase-like protein [Trichoplusia ni ascovirus 2c]ABF70589.1 hypothetical protein [Trichoplusia ni ascovirus 2c]